MKKLSKIVILPTEKANSDISKGNKTGVLAYHQFFRGTEGIYVNHTYQHLYFLSDDEIKVGDWVYWNDPEELTSDINKVISIKGDVVLLSHPEHSEIECYPNECKKIIATTDESLKIWIGTCFSGEEIYKKLPRPSNEFIKKYCELGGIDEVVVEYEKCNICQDTKKHIVSMFGEVDCYYCNKTEGRENQYIEPKLKVAPDNTITIYPVV